MSRDMAIAVIARASKNSPIWYLIRLDEVCVKVSAQVICEKSLGIFGPHQSHTCWRKVDLIINYLSAMVGIRASKL